MRLYLGVAVSGPDAIFLPAITAGGIGPLGPPGFPRDGNPLKHQTNQLKPLT